ncbi:MAG: binding-protein-dependent transport system inner rane component [Acidimicrobiia bacterium]|nr:binding-protein-dependent transport system inner rane component [Acidimicrobiia bacterium]
MNAMLRIGRSLLTGVISIGVVLLAWVAFLKVFHVDSFIGKGPNDVRKWLFTSDGAGTHRAIVRHESWITLRDALLGLLCGTVAAVSAAIAFNLYAPVQRTFMPIAMVLRSVPLVAMAPLIVLVFGRGLTTVAVIAGIVTFFPTLVNVTLALAATPKDSIDLLRAYGASPLKTLVKVKVPSSLPALFASLRVAAPLALVGALLAEWLTTGQGLGYSILRASALSDYSGLWSRVALVTMYSVLLYNVIGGLEVLVMRKFAGTTTRAL